MMDDEPQKVVKRENFKRIFYCSHFFKYFKSINTNPKDTEPNITTGHSLHIEQIKEQQSVQSVYLISP